MVGGFEDQKFPNWLRRIKEFIKKLWDPWVDNSIGAAVYCQCYWISNCLIRWKLTLLSVYKQWPYYHIENIDTCIPPYLCSGGVRFVHGFRGISTARETVEGGGHGRYHSTSLPKFFFLRAIQFVSAYCAYVIVKSYLENLYARAYKNYTYTNIYWGVWNLGKVPTNNIFPSLQNFKM